MGIIARHWQPESDGRVTCLLCPHRCLISKDKTGLCLIRKNIDGALQQTAYGQICTASMDPIEKKPLYHFHPGSKILSVGTNGCNMKCRHCQNWQISTQITHRQDTTPEKLLRIAHDNKSIGIAYTYNEPLVWFEFVEDCSRVFKKDGMKNVLVSNGQINPEPLKDLLPFLDAANIDLKGFTDDFYKNEGGSLDTVINTIEAMAASGIHLEITNLLIPKLNDDIEIFEKMCRYISGISKNIPLHISRYFPQHKSSMPVTETEMLKEYRETALKHLNYVFIGNADIKGTSDTLCPECGFTIIERNGFSTVCNTEKNICPNCSSQLSVCF